MRTVNISEEVIAILPGSFKDQFVEQAQTGPASCAKCNEVIGDDEEISVIVCVDEDPEYKDKLTQAMLAHSTCLDSGVWETAGLYEAYQQAQHNTYHVVLGDISGMPLAVFEPADIHMSVAEPSGDLNDSWISTMLGAGLSLMMMIPAPGADVPPADNWTVKRTDDSIVMSFMRPDMTKPAEITLSGNMAEAEGFWNNALDKGGVVIVTGSGLNLTNPEGLGENLQNSINFGRVAWGLASIDEG